MLTSETSETNLQAALKSLNAQQPVQSGQWPVIWHLDITSRCNLSCLYCQRDFFVKTKHPFLKGDMSDELFDSVLPYFKHAKLVALLSMLGEPLTVKALPRWWTAIIDRGAKPQTTTNGTFLTEELADLFTSTGGRLKVSVDSFDQETLDLLRPNVAGKRGVEPDMLRDRLRLIDRRRKVHNNDGFQLGINLCITAKNLAHTVATMEECLQLARVDVFTLAPFRMPRDEKGMHHESAGVLSLDMADEQTKQGWRDIIRWAARRRQTDNVEFVLPWSQREWRGLIGDEANALVGESYSDADDEPEAVRETKYYCCVPWLKVSVLADGSVIPCHLLHWPSPELSFGNLSKSPFEEIWRGPAYTEFRKSMTQGRNMGFCRECRSWWRWYTPQRID